MRIVVLKEAIINLDLLASVVVHPHSIKLNMAGVSHEITDADDIKKLREIWNKEKDKAGL